MSKVVSISPEAVAEKHRKSTGVDLQARLEKLEDSLLAAVQEMRAVKSELRKQSDHPTGLEKLLDASEVAEKLGQAERWIYQQVKAKKMPAIKLGKYVKFSPPELQKWLERKQTS